MSEGQRLWTMLKPILSLFFLFFSRWKPLRNFTVSVGHVGASIDEAERDLDPHARCLARANQLESRPILKIVN